MTIKYCELDLEDDKKQISPSESLLFPCTAYFTDIKNRMMGTLPWHWHEEIELLIVKKGSVKITFPQEAITLTVGQGCFINSNTLHTAHTIGADDCILHSILFLPILISGPVESIFNQQYVRPLITAGNLPYQILNSCVDWQRAVLETLEAAYSIHEKSAVGFEWEVRTCMANIWQMLLTHSQESLKNPLKTSDNALERVKTMVAFIQSNYYTPISLADIAASANLSERECLRTFKKGINISPMQYLNQYRINVATKHLLDTDYDVTVICTEVGIDNPSYFSKKFKEVHGLTPTEFRKQKV